MKHRTLRRQPIIKGVTRERIGAGVLEEIDKEIRRLQHVYGVSRSWIIATILADALKIRSQPRYYATEVPGKIRKRRSA